MAGGAWGKLSLYSNKKPEKSQTLPVFGLFSLFYCLGLKVISTTSAPLNRVWANF